jgi:uncharacterized protein YndB with AHSA1/START domain
MTTRSASHTLEMAAPPDAIWTALTDPFTLTQWFATHADIDLRPGGRYAISWHGDWAWPMTVVRCEPRACLVLRDERAVPFDVNGQPIDSATPHVLTLEFHLTASPAGTVVRVVHAGFGHGEHWDDELDGVTTGWAVELHVLRHYVERCFGRRRTQAWAKASTDAPPDVVWGRLTASEGLLRNGEVFALEPGAHAKARFASGEVLEGPVMFGIPNRHLLLRADNAGDGLLNVTVHRSGGRSMAQVVLATWAQPAEEVAAFERRVQSRLEQVI